MNLNLRAMNIHRGVLQGSGMILLSFRMTYHCPHSQQILFILLILGGKHYKKYFHPLFKLQAPHREEVFHFFLCGLYLAI